VRERQEVDPSGAIIVLKVMRGVSALGLHVQHARKEQASSCCDGQTLPGKQNGCAETLRISDIGRQSSVECVLT
jgi:hypothetical protein